MYIEKSILNDECSWHGACAGSQPNVIAETDTFGNVQDCYIYGLGLAYKLMPDGTTYTYHFDSREAPLQ